MSLRQIELHAPSRRGAHIEATILAVPGLNKAENGMLLGARANKLLIIRRGDLQATRSIGLNRLPREHKKLVVLSLKKEDAGRFEVITFQRRKLECGPLFWQSVSRNPT